MPGERATSESNRTVFRRFAKYLRNEENLSTIVDTICHVVRKFLGIAPTYIQKHHSTMVATMTSLTQGWSFSVSVYSCPNKTRCCWCAWSENDANGQDGRHYQTGEPNVVDERFPLNNTGLQAQKTSQQYQYKPSISLGTWYWNSIKRPSSIFVWISNRNHLFLLKNTFQKRKNG